MANSISAEVWLDERRWDALEVVLEEQGSNNVTSDSNGDWINVYANYDLETGGPEQSLTVVLVCGDGNEFEFSYPLTASEREQLREKMEGYCQSQAGMSLDNYRQELCSEESSMEQGPQM